MNFTYIFLIPNTHFKKVSVISLNHKIESFETLVAIEMSLYSINLIKV